MLISWMLPSPYYGETGGRLTLTVARLSLVDGVDQIDMDMDQRVSVH